MSTKNKYRIPVPHNLLELIDRISSPAHVGNLRNAVDFIVPSDTPVLAAADGTITYVKDDSNIGALIHRIGTIPTLSQSCTKTESIPGMITWYVMAQR